MLELLNKQSQLDIIHNYYTAKWNCDKDIFRRNENVILETTDNFFEFYNFGSSAVLRVDKSITDWCNENLLNIKFDRILENDKLYQMLHDNGKLSVWRGTRYLYLYNNPIRKPEGYTYKLFNKDDLHLIPKDDKYRQALSFDGSDVIAIAAFDGDIIASIAGADNRMGDIWQIGINTLPEYRNRGLAVYLVKTLSDEIVSREILPFYNTWSCNIASSNVAINSGYRPVWTTFEV